MSDSVIVPIVVTVLVMAAVVYLLVFEVRRQRSSRESAVELCYMGMDGRLSVADLIGHLAQVAPGVPLEEVGINFGTVTWVDDATDEEKRQRAAWRAESAARRAKWERETYERLKAQFEPSELSEG